MPQRIPESAMTWFTNAARRADADTVNIISNHMEMPFNKPISKLNLA